MGEVSLQALVNALSSEDAGQSSHAFQRLRDLGPAARAAVPELLEIVDKVDGVFQILQAIGPAAKAAIPILRKKFLAGALYAADALVAIDNEIALQVFLDSRHSPDTQMRHSAILHLKDLAARFPNQVVPALIEAFQDMNPEIRASAAFDFVELTGGAGLPALTEALAHPNAHTRIYAAYSLITSDSKKHSRAVVPVARNALQDPDREIRKLAAKVLSNVGRRASSAIEELMAALVDRDNDVRYYVASALGEIGPGAAQATSALANALKDQDEWVRQTAAGALMMIGPAAEAAISDLVEALKDPEPAVRGIAAGALGSIGREDKDIVDALLRIARKDPDPDARKIAANALEAITGKRHRNRCR